MDRDLQDALGRLARRQHGVVTRAQLLDLGFTPGAIRHRVRSGWLHRLHRGVYLAGPIRPPRAREMAAVLACGGETFVAGSSGAMLWSLLSPLAGGNPPVRVLTVGGASADRPGIRVKRVARLDREDRAEVDRIPVTAPGRTLIDLAAEVGRRDLERAVARAEREQLVTRAQLRERVARHRGRPAAPALREVLERSGGPAFTRSVAEARFLRLIRDAHLPVPETNARVAGYEVDFLWRAHGIAIEVDGYRFHASRPRFEADRRRATRLASRGILIIPVTWRQIVEESMATAVQVGQALVQVRFRRPGGAHPGPRATQAQQ